LSDPIRLLIIDDHAVVRKGLAMVLRLEPDLEVVAEAGDGRTGLELARAFNPDIVLLDLIMPGMDGQDVALALRYLAGDCWS
jgi:NarL family two-component system response regulator LiaR